MPKSERESQIPSLLEAVEVIAPGDSDVVLRGLDYIGAPDHLPALYWVVGNINTILPICKELKDKCIDAYCCIEWFVEIIEKLKTTPAYMDHKVFSLSDKNKDKDKDKEPPFYGVLGSHPVYCSLWYMYSSPGKEEKSYQRLQALFLSVNVLKIVDIKRSFIPSDKMGYTGRLLRQIATDDGQWFEGKFRNGTGNLKRTRAILTIIYNRYKKLKPKVSANEKLREQNKYRVERNTHLKERNKLLCEEKLKLIDIPEKQEEEINDEIRRNEEKIERNKQKIDENNKKINPDINKNLLEPMDEYAGAFARVLHRCWPKKVSGPRGRRGHGNNRKGDKRTTSIKPGHQMWALLSGDDGDPGSDAFKWSPPKSQPGKKGYADEEEDIPNNEWSEDDNVLANSDPILGDANSNPKELPPLSSLMVAAHARARYISMANQRFRSERHRVRPWQARCILEKIENFAERAFRIGEEPAIETAILSGVMLVTASTFDTARNIIIANDKDDLPDDYVLAYSPRYKVFVRPAIYHPTKTLLARSSDVTEEWGEHIVLDNITRVGAWLSGYAEKHGVSPGKNIFHSRRITTFERLYKDNIGVRLREQGLSKRFQKISGAGNMFYDWLVTGEEGNAVIPALISGRTDILGDVPLYYTSVNRKQVMEQYEKSWKSFAEAINSEGYECRDNGMLLQHGSQSREIAKNTGAQEVITFDTVKGLIQSSLIMIDEFKALPYENFHRKAHNALTSYVGLVLAIITGFRAVYTPILDLAKYDHETGFMALQEKDQQSESHGRIVWLPAPVQKLIDLYVSHLKVLGELRAEEHGYEFQIKLTKNRDKAKKDSVLVDVRNCFYYISDNGKAEEFSGQRLKEELGSAYVSSNAGRRFLRSALTAKNCPEAIINAVMGHWSRGEEVWGKYSTFDPRIYRKELARYLNPLLEDIGFSSLDEYRQLQ